MLCTANGQTSGIGQQNKIWVSPYGLNVYATYGFLLNQKDIAKIFSIPQVSALPVVELLSKEGIECNIKWVNDVLINKKKVCGILAESFSNAFEENDDVYSAILIGIGINVNSSFENLIQISQPATSMKIETKKEFDIKKIIESLSNLLIYNINKLISDGFDAFKVNIEDKLERFDGKPVAFTGLNSSYKVGYIKGLSDNGELILSNNTEALILTDGRIARGADLEDALGHPEIMNQLAELAGLMPTEDYSY
jgi:BirA family biotin operon repressor/biotin-[acetyl-CoA-carboxylase] ligase